MMKRLGLLVGMLVLCASSLWASPAGIDMSFETGMTGSSDYIAAPCGWNQNTLTGQYAICGNAYGWNTEFVDMKPFDGNQFLFGNGSLLDNQTVWKDNMTAEAGQTYQVGFAAGSPCCRPIGAGYLDPGYVPSLLTLSVIYGDVEETLVSIWTDIVHPGTWVFDQTTWIAPVSQDVTFRLRDMTTVDTGNDFAIDGVTVKNVTQTPVPEPASMMLFGTGALVLARRMRRRTKG